MRILVIMLPLLVLMSGCTDSADTQEGPGSEAAAAAPAEEPIALSIPWHLDGAGLVVVTTVTQSSDHMHDFEITRAGTATVSTTWSCAAQAPPACPMRMMLSQGGHVVSEITGPSPLSTDLNLEVGRYTLQMFPDFGPSVAVQTEGTFELMME